MGAHVINASWSELCGPEKEAIPGRLRCNAALRSQKQTKMVEAFDVIGLDKVLIVAAGIDEGQADLDEPDVQDLPTELPLPNVFSITASSPVDNVANIGGNRRVSFGSGTYDLAAPGQGMVGLTFAGRVAPGPLDPDGHGGLTSFKDDAGVTNLTLFLGTSAAAPLVAGTASLMLSQCPSLAGQPTVLKSIITSTADCGLPGLAGVSAGACRLNTRNAVAAVTQGVGDQCPP